VHAKGAGTWQAAKKDRVGCVLPRLDQHGDVEEEDFVAARGLERGHHVGHVRVGEK